MMLSSLPTATAITIGSQAFATPTFARGSWQQDCLAKRGSSFGLSGKDTLDAIHAGHRPYRPSNTPIT